LASKIYLASGSPRRRELLQQMGVQFDVVSASVEEKIKAGETGLAYVQRLALEKAQAGLAQVQRQNFMLAPVLGADTLGIMDNKILEKPKDEKDAAEILRSLSGRTHQVITAIALVSLEKIATAYAITEVTFRVLSETEIRDYWLTGEPCDKAGGYAIQGLGAVFVKSIHGSYSNVVGLPIETCCELLSQFEIPWWQTSVNKPDTRKLDVKQT
jgi:septum formation protein